MLILLFIIRLSLQIRLSLWLRRAGGKDKQLILYFRYKYELCIRKILFHLFPDKYQGVLLYRFISYGGVEIVHHGVEADSPVAYGFEAEQCVIDTS